MTIPDLIAFVEGQAYCPCCGEVRECDPECTYREDCEESGKVAQARYEQMLAARCALGDKTEGR